jgi:hypothetical protein
MTAVPSPRFEEAISVAIMYLKTVMGECREQMIE